MTKMITITLNDWTALIHLNENEALTLLHWLPESITSTRFYENDNLDKPWTIGRVHIPEDFWTDAFWDDSNGREILDKWGINGSRDYYYFSLDDYEKLKADLEANPYWKVWNESLRYWQYNVELEIVTANEEVGDD